MSEEDVSKNLDQSPQNPPADDEPSKEDQTTFKAPEEYTEREQHEKHNYNTQIAIVLAIIIVGILAFFFLNPFSKSSTHLSVSHQLNASPPIVMFDSFHSSALNVSLAYTLRPKTPNSSINLSKSTINWGDGSLTPITDTSHTYSSYSNYTVSLNVYDTANGKNFTSKLISLAAPTNPNPVNVVHNSIFPPSISFYTHQSGLLVRVNGTVLPYPNIPTKGVKITNVSINWGDGTTTNGSNQYIHNYSFTGAYKITVSATDSLGDTNRANRSVVLTANPSLQLGGICPSIPPSLTINNPKIEGLSVSLSGTRGPSVTSGTISWGDGTTTFFDQYSHTYSAPGNYAIDLTGYDKCGMRTVYTLHVQLSLASYPPVVSLSPPNVTGYRVDIKGYVAATAPGASIDWSRTTIDWGDGNTTLALNGYIHNYSQPNTYNIAVVATDNLGDRNASIFTLKVPYPKTQSQNFPSALTILNVGQNLSVGPIKVVLENVAGPDKNGYGEAILGIYKNDLLSSTVTMLPLTTYNVNVSGTYLMVYVGQTFLGVAGNNWAEMQVLPLRS